ncbi:alpha/beta fold hydrolase [Motiliproteus sp. SC1-56]|uniref:alpha/beta fold hydrolase n=1 Tax=Motiliproteus sp. SC1-56 TaxID=2799565 RepID=UPI001A8DE2FC|nr:alpha/beta hydrolase [Motiliproteus sp. SC1-56]
MSITSAPPYVEQSGQGAPMVFIHGSFANTATWRKIVTRLAPHRHCIAINLPGHGGTADPGDFAAPDINTELALIERVVTELTDQPIHLVGHSYGGVVALAQALKGNLPLSALTLFEPVAAWVLDAVGDPRARDVAQFVAGYRRDSAAEVADAWGQVLEFWGGPGAFDALPEHVRPALSKLARNNLRHWDICTRGDYDADAITRLAVPTRVVWGSESHPAAQAIGHHLHRLIPDSRQAVIEGASHFMVTSHPVACAELLT